MGIRLRPHALIEIPPPREGSEQSLFNEAFLDSRSFGSIPKSVQGELPSLSQRRISSTVVRLYEVPASLHGIINNTNQKTVGQEIYRKTSILSVRIPPTAEASHIA